MFLFTGNPSPVQNNEAKPDGLPTVKNTCDNGKLFTTFVSGSDCAIIWDRNLKSRFHGPLWLGTLDIRKVGSDTDFGQTVMEGFWRGCFPRAIRGHFARGFRWTRRVFGSQRSTVVWWRAVSSCFNKLVQDCSSWVERVRPPRNEPASKYRTDFQRIPVGKASLTGRRQR
jgi:hypothetical protein